MSLKGKSILVTGSEGFIGSHLTERLVREGARVKAFVLYNSFGSWGWLDTLDKDILKNIEIFAGDVRDPNGVREAVKGCEIVMHLAALIAIPYSYHSPDMYIDTNIKGTLNILQAARDLGVARVLHTSTSEVYGTAQFVPITEDHPLQGQSPYSASKIGADQIALSFYRSFETPVAVIRPFNTYGPRQSLRAFIPSVITQIASGAPEIRVGSLEPTRDFSYVEDTASGFVSAATAQNVVGEVVNLGSGFEISMGDTVKMIKEMMGSKIQIVSEDVRKRPEKSEVFRLFADVKKAERLMGWQARNAGLEGFRRGLQKTIDWFRADQNLQRYKTGHYTL